MFHRAAASVRPARRALWIGMLLLGLGSSALADDLGRGVQIAASGPKRVALVIGNGLYDHLDSPPSAVADAETMAQGFEAAGFETTLRLDLDLSALKRVVRQFKARLSPGDEALFFFAGHGVQLEGANYLLPTDIVGDSEEQVMDEALALQRVLDDLTQQQVRLSLAIVAACRDNPFAAKGRGLGGGRGLAPVGAANGQMIVFAAGSGQRALDRVGEGDVNPNSLFVRVFADEMARPGVEIRQLVRNVRSRVVAAAKSVGAEQVPAFYDQMEGDFYFRLASSEGETTRTNAAAQLEMAFWASIEQSDDPAYFQAYLKQYPAGSFVDRARKMVAPQGGVSRLPVGERWDPYRFVVGGAAFEMVPLAGGSFTLGNKELDHADLVAQITLPPFQIMRTEVTQALFKAVMGNQGDWPVGDEYPVLMTWAGAQTFIARLNTLTGQQFRIPSEAQWEYAVRAGTESQWFWGRNGQEGDDYAWWSQNSGGEIHPVAQKKPNPWGLYDMSGNVREWCQDTFHFSYDGIPPDGSPWEVDGERGTRVVRGGGNRSPYISYLASSWREAGDISTGAGLRLIRMVVATDPVR